jgi:hypothetical protein
MSQSYKVEVVQEGSELKIKVRNIDCFFVITSSKEVLDARGNVRPEVFSEILSTTFRDLAPEISSDKRNREFEIVTIYDPSLSTDFTHTDLSRKTSSLLKTLSDQGLLQNHSAIKAQVYLENKASGEVYHMLAGFTIRSGKRTIYILDSNQGVRPM